MSTSTCTQTCGLRTGIKVNSVWTQTLDVSDRKGPSYSITNMALGTDNIHMDMSRKTAAKEYMTNMGMGRDIHMDVSMKTAAKDCMTNMGMGRYCRNTELCYTPRVMHSSCFVVYIWRYSVSKNCQNSSRFLLFYCGLVQRLDLVNSSPLSARYMRQWTGAALVQIMACRLFGTMPLSKPMLGYC